MNNQQQKINELIQKRPQFRWSYVKPKSDGDYRFLVDPGADEILIRIKNGEITVLRGLTPNYTPLYNSVSLNSWPSGAWQKLPSSEEIETLLGLLPTLKGVNP